MNPFDNIEQAFAVFYTDSIKITLKDLQQPVTVRCCVFQCEDDDPLSEDAIDTERLSIQLVVSKPDWTTAQRVRRGDTFTRGGKTYAVQLSRYDETLGYIIKARQK